jgi:DNA-binding HxlR family transcriptional regulator
MKRTSFDDMKCSIARTLNLIGEWWTPLILRDIFFGVRRFEPLLHHLGISRNILTDRLQTLVDHQILERRLYQERPARYEYVLTERGRDLFPILVAVMEWGNKWLADSGPPTELIHQECGQVVKPVFICSACGQEITRRNVRARRSSDNSMEEGERLKKAPRANS